MKDSPKLQNPGAGVPASQLFFLKLYFGLKCRLSSQKSLASDYQKHRKWIIETIRLLKEKEKSKQVLISPTMALEDSSRNWSIFQTLEHLTIVDTGLTGIIKDLTALRTPSTIVRTKDVKPSDNPGPSAEKTFISLTSRSTRQLRELPVERGGPTHAHPWFGELDAHQWLALRTVHLSVHIRQMKKILTQLV